jgi:membrane-associated phospholipid phosphatase
VSVSGGLKQAVAERSVARRQWIRANVARYLALLARKPRPAVRSSWLAPLRLGIGAVAAIALVVATMLTLDAWAIGAVRGMPGWLVALFDDVTHFGKSVRFLLPIALMLAAIAALASPALPRVSQRVLAAVAVRLGFLFLAVGLPGLLFAAIKRLIGRARPLVEGGADPFIYRPFGWVVEYASLPSGHAIDAFAIATAVGALWPRARMIMCAYAVIIAVSRVVLTAHFPSDVVAGAVVGVVGALLVREWFAARGLAFILDRNGAIRPMPGPSFARIKRVARQMIAS